MTPKTAQAVITCNGSTQSLATFLTVDQHYRHIIIHHLTTGGDDIYFGYEDDSDANNHVWHLPADTPPFMMEFARVSLRPINIYFKGTNGDKFSIGAIAGLY